MWSDRLRALDAVEQIDLIESFAERGRDAFFGDLLLQSAILHRLALLGEACRGFSSEIRAARPDIPWARIVALRNMVMHEYFGLDLDLVWEIVAERLDELRNALVEILTAIEGSTDT